MTDPAPLRILGDEQSLLDPTLADGGLPPVVGVHSYQVFRASRDAPARADQRGWTYHHHVDIAAWHGKLYVTWNTCEHDEDVWPSRELFSTSVDGVTWASPQELFPQGSSTPLRVYFYLASNKRMLAIAGLRIDTGKTSEDLKGGLLVREITTDHALRDVFILQNPGNVPTDLPSYDASSDDGFIAACKALLADAVFLEQQDRGRLLGDRAMPWHNAANWPDGVMPGAVSGGRNGKWVFGKAFSFFTRPDGAIVGVSKMGWTIVSHDAGKTWARPVVPPTLVTGKAKVYCHPTGDGRYALVYNPSKSQRYPLVVVTGDDGITFANMRVIQGQLPIQRYAGADRSIGPQYTRGLSKWADDGSLGRGALWLVYSMSKEDIWVSRVPVPIVADSDESTIDDDLTDSKTLSRWNIYKPAWCDIEHSPHGLKLTQRDPYDHLVLTRTFRRSKSVRVEVEGTNDPNTRLDIELHSHYGSKVLAHATAKGESSTVLTTEGDLSRLIIRTAPHRNIGGKQPVPIGNDAPTAPATVLLRRVRITTA